MTKNELLQLIVDRLGDNYSSSDQNILSQIVDEKINIAINVSNRDIDLTISDTNLKLLSPEIIQACVISYQERGAESSKSKSELGESSTFIDSDELLRNNIIKNGKRVIF